MQLHREYENKNFYSNLKYARIMFFIAAIISVITFVVDIIYFAFELPGSIYLEWDTSDVIFYCVWVYVAPLSYFIGNVKIKKTSLPETKLQNDYIILLFNALCFALYFIIILNYVIFSALFGDYQDMLESVEILGRMLISYIFLAIGSGFMIRSAIIAKNDLAIHPPEYKRAEIEQKQAEQRLLEEKMRIQNYRNLVDMAGKKFFLKYYYIIRDLSFADAMDSIENYSYEDKQRRVQAVKNIFSLNLQKFALEKIIQESTGEINAEIKAEAEEIYNKEFTKND